jgi:hypothetical protein
MDNLYSVRIQVAMPAIPSADLTKDMVATFINSFIAGQGIIYENQIFCRLVIVMIDNLQVWYLVWQ